MSAIAECAGSVTVYQNHYHLKNQERISGNMKKLGGWWICLKENRLGVGGLGFLIFKPRRAEVKDEKR